MRHSPRSARAAFERIPDPYRGWIGARRARRWLRAMRFERAHNARMPLDAPTVSFYPMRLEPTAAIAQVLPRIGARIASSPVGADLTVAWHTGTWLDQRHVERLPRGALNRECTDISKRTVDELWAQVAGYSIAVDPTTWQGPLVVKPLENAVRGGRVIAGPIKSRRSDVVYERLVDSRVGDRIHSTRAMVACGRMLLAYDRWRPQPHWFRGPEETVPGDPETLYSEDERDALIRFAELIGLDFGEIDVIRDNESGRIYAVDANRTPVRPRSLPREYDDAVFGPMSEAFAELLRDA